MWWNDDLEHSDQRDRDDRTTRMYLHSHLLGRDPNQERSDAECLWHDNHRTRRSCMGLPLRTAFPLLVISASACAGDEGDLFCAADDFHAWPKSEALFRCEAAVRFAARDTSELVPTQTEVDR